MAGFNKKKHNATLHRYGNDDGKRWPGRRPLTKPARKSQPSQRPANDTVYRRRLRLLLRRRQAPTEKISKKYYSCRLEREKGDARPPRHLSRTGNGYADNKRRQTAKPIGLGCCFHIVFAYTPRCCGSDFRVAGMKQPTPPPLPPSLSSSISSFSLVVCFSRHNG